MNTKDIGCLVLFICGVLLSEALLVYVVHKVDMYWRISNDCLYVVT